MNVQYSIILEPMLYKFKLGHNAVEATKNICCLKDDGSLDHCKVSRWLKKFHLAYKNLNEQAFVA